MFKRGHYKGKIPPFIGTLNAVITRQGGNTGSETERRTGDIFLNIHLEMKQKMKEPSAYPINGHADIEISNQVNRPRLLVTGIATIYYIKNTKVFFNLNLHAKCSV